MRSISIAEIKPAEAAADAVQPVEPAVPVAEAAPVAAPEAPPPAEPIVAAVPAEPAQEQKQDQSPLESQHEPALSNGNGQSKALVPLEDNSPKKNGGTELAENNNNPSNVAEAEGQQKVR